MYDQQVLFNLISEASISSLLSGSSEGWDGVGDGGDVGWWCPGGVRGVCGESARGVGSNGGVLPSWSQGGSGCSSSARVNGFDLEWPASLLLPWRLLLVLLPELLLLWLLLLWLPELLLALPLSLQLPELLPLVLPLLFAAPEGACAGGR